MPCPWHPERRDPPRVYCELIPPRATLSAASTPQGRRTSCSHGQERHEDAIFRNRRVPAFWCSVAALLSLIATACQLIICRRWSRVSAADSLQVERFIWLCSSFADEAATHAGPQGRSNPSIAASASPMDRCNVSLNVSLNVASVLDGLQQDFNKVRSAVGREDARLLDEHAALVRQMERELQSQRIDASASAPPELEPGIKQRDENMPKLSHLQIELMVRAFVADFARIATLQYAYSTGDTVMSWLDISGRHHDISHKPDDDQQAQQELTRINRWYCEQVATLHGDSPKRRSLAASGACWTIQRSCGPTSWVKETATRTKTSPSCSSAAGLDSARAARSSSPPCHTTGC